MIIDKLSIFEFNVQLVNSEVSGTDLKSKYFEFVVNVLNNIKGKVVSLSDMYVKDITDNSITFALEISPTMFISNYLPERYHFPVFYRFGENISVPQDVVSPWAVWTPRLDDVHKEENVYRYSKKTVINVSSDYEYNVFYTNIRKESFGFKQKSIILKMYLIIWIFKTF